MSTKLREKSHKNIYFSSQFTNFQNLDQMKQVWQSVESEKGETLPTCISVQRVATTPSRHFDMPVSTEKTSVHVSSEVFACGKQSSSCTDTKTGSVQQYAETGT